ncbi:hypothetical protein RMATCC62417_17476 [Rhizopus microsporus]|nr:hypothetical protein RMATCC62417_17476 [Rhizopus microsporus]
MVEPSSFDHSENAFMNSSSYDERRAHSFRSMSLGSLHNTNSSSSNNMLGTPGNPSTPSLLYTPSLATNAAAGRMNVNNSNNKLPNNALPSSYYTNPLYSNTAGFSPLPSPSSITSSPMLSPVHQSFPHPRHYSISSASSGPIQRFAARNSFDLMSGIQTDRQQQPSPSQQQQQQQHHPHPTSQQQQQQQQPSSSQQQSIHPHMLPDMFLSGDTHIKAENDTSVNTGSEAVGISTPATGASGFSSSPNIGQLLNPIHPLNTTIKQNDPSMTNAQLFQSMNISSPSKYQDFSLPSTTAATPSGTPHFDSFSNNNNNHYYEQQQQQQQQQQTVTDSDHHYHHHQEQQDTHSSNNLVPLFRNGMVLPNANSSSMYDESASDLGIEPLMLK